MRLHQGWCVVSILCALALSAGGAERTAQAAEPPGWVELDQGWDAETKLRFWFTSQGSQLIPYRWFVALEQANTERPFAEADHMERFRYLPAARDAKYNPDALPIGFVKDEDADAAMGGWLGLSCAACHTSRIAYQGKTIQVEGAPAMADFQAFHKAMTEALFALLRDPAKFRRFAAKVNPKGGQAESDALFVDVAKQIQTFERFTERNGSPHPYGFARLDAFTILVNEIVGTFLKEPENYRIPGAPVSYPFLWNTPKLAWVQWNGSADNPLSRNVGECLGVFGKANLTSPPPDLFKSTVRVGNLFKLEQWVDQLKPPAWPEAVLGKINRDRATRGSGLYQKLCVSCHADKPPYPMTPPNQFGKSFIQIKMVPLDQVRTDPMMAASFASRLARPGSLGPFLAKIPDLKPGAEYVPAAVLIEIAIGGIIKRQFAEMNLSPQEQLAYVGFRPPGQAPPNILAYKAGPLAGIWATAPYLHNGSVPSLADLLKPAAQRPKQFQVGSTQFDPMVVGFRSDVNSGTFLFDTGLPGNSNAGHEYGTSLSESDRTDLLEYLKTL